MYKEILWVTESMKKILVFCKIVIWEIISSIDWMEKFGIEDGLSIYYKYFTKEDEKEFGVVAIRMTPFLI